MRKLLIAMAGCIGVVSILLTARYGYKQADEEIDRWIAAVMFGSISLCAFVFDALAVRLWFVGWHKAGGFIGFIAALAFVVTFSNSLGGIVSRADTVQAQRQNVTDARADNRRELQRLEQAIKEYLEDHNRNPRPFVWTADADLILGRVKAICERTSDSGH